MDRSHHPPSPKQAAPFLLFAILALLVSAHAGCISGGLLEETPPNPGDPSQKAPPTDENGLQSDPDYYGYDGYYHYG